MATRSTADPRCVVILLLCGMAGCSDADSGPPLVVQRDSAGIEIVEALRPLWGDSSLWHIDPEPLLDLTTSGDAPQHEFFRVRGVQQHADGSIVLADRQAREIRRYSSAGAFLGALGGRGRGPGEFRNLQRVEIVADSAFALDFDGRVTVIGPDMEFARVFDLPSQVSDIHFLGEGTLLAEAFMWEGLEEVANQLIRPSVALLLFDLEGVPIDSLGVRPGSESYSYNLVEDYGDAPALFPRAGQVATLGARIFYGSSDLMQVEEMDPSGRVVRLLRIPGYPLDLTDAQIAAERNSRLDMDLPPGMTLPPFIRRIVEALPAPVTRPAYAEMLVDPSGAVWLELYRGGSEQDRPQEWLVLDADGTWLGTVEVPDGFRVTDVTMETVLGVWRDEVDVEHPQVLRLTRGEM